MTKEIEIQEQKLAEKAHQRRKRILKLKKVGAIAWLELGKELHLVEKNKDWISLGHESMRVYMATPEASGGLDLTRAWMIQFKLNYEKFVLELGYPGNQLALLEPTKLREIRKVVTEGNLEEWLGKARGLSRSAIMEEIRELFQKNIPPIPKGQFRVIYADPPWEFWNEGFEESAKQHYETMPVDEIKSLKIPSADNSILFLWVVNTHIKEGLEVCQSWGFDYKTNMVWIKSKGPSIGWYTIPRHEMLFIGIKGRREDPKEKFKSWFEAPTTEHSRKPEIVYDFIERMYEGPYLELFARNKDKRKNWTYWGNKL